MALKLIVKLWALSTVSGLLPVIVPLNDDANGGKKQEMVVTVEDSNKGLNYVAAGVGRYNNKQVDARPTILSGCTAQYRYRNPFSAGALAAPEAQCWGEFYSRVDTAGYFVDEKTNSAICNRWTQPIKTMGAGADLCGNQPVCRVHRQFFTKSFLGDDAAVLAPSSGADSNAKNPLKLEVLASDSDGCKTQDGTYYVYMYAKKATTVTVTIEQADSGKKCKNSKKSERAAAIVIGVLVVLCCCCCIAGAIAFSMHQQKQQQQHLDNPAYGEDPGGTVMTDYGPAPAYTTPAADKPPAYGAPPAGAGPIQGSVVAPPAGTTGGPIQGSVVAPPPASAPPASAPPPAYDAPPAYGA